MEDTIRLYDNDAYACEFTATVVKCTKSEIKSGKDTIPGYNVILDQTLFFPEEGGQSPDKGTINEIDVLDVQIKNNVITHFVKEEIPSGTEIKGKINWTHRFNNMQQHSGEHIFSGLVHNKFGYDNVGFHLSDQIVTMDFNGVLSPEDVSNIEFEVNKIISENRKITVTYPSKEELANMDYRSKIEIKGQVRIVTIEETDVCACCAPHVRMTGEVGMLKVMSTSNYKGGVRISILCGFRALEAFREKSAIVNDLTTYLTTGQENLLDTVTKLKSNNQSLNSELAKLKQKALEDKLASISSDQKDVIIFESGLDTKIIRNVVNSLMELHEGVCGIFVGDDENGYNYVVGSNNVDCKEIANTMREKLNAKGGGNNKMIQGSVTAKSDAIAEIIISR